MAPELIRLIDSGTLMLIRFPDLPVYELSAEYLRVYSPSAEVRNTGTTKMLFPDGKKEVGILAVERSGHYAVRLVFSDGHNSGIYTWRYLLELATSYERRWREYLAQLQARKLGRSGDESVVRFV